MTEKFTFKRYQQLVEAQGQALIEIAGAAALGRLAIEVEIPEGIELLTDLAVCLGFLLDDLRELAAERDQLEIRLNRAGLAQSEAASIQTDWQNRRLAILNELARALATADNEADLFHLTAGYLPRIFEVERASVALVDETNGQLNVFALSGEAGLIPTGSSLPIAKTAAGVVFRTGQVNLVPDTSTADPIWLDVRRLRENQIRSIMNAPLTVEGQVIGTLNLGSAQLNAFSLFDQQLIAQLAMVLSLTLQNKRFMVQTQHRLHRERLLHELTAQVRRAVDVDTVLRTAARGVGQALHRSAFIYLRPLQQTVGAGWQGFQSEMPTGYFFNQGQLEPLPNGWIEVLQGVDATGPSIRVHLHSADYPAIAAPLRVYNEALGLVGLGEDPENPLSTNEVALLEAVSEQVALALENAQLFEQTQAALADNERLYEGSGRVISATTIDQILKALVDSTVLRQFDQIGILLFDRPLVSDERPETFEVIALWERPANPLRQFISLQDDLAELPLDYFMGKPDGPYLIGDIQTNPDLDQAGREIFTERFGIRSLAVWPLVVGESWFGALSGQSSRPFQFEEKAIRQINSLVDQAATTIQNRRLFRQTQEALSETEMLYEFSQELMTTTNLDQVLQVAGGPSIEQGANRITLISFELDTTDQPEWAEVSALWSQNSHQDRVARERPGHRFYLNDHSLAQFWLAVPDHPRLIGDIETEPDLAETVRRYYEEQGARAMVVVPLRLGGRWVGILNIAWAQPVIFSGRDRRLYQALLSQTAAVVENRRLIARTQQALAIAEVTQRRYTLQAWENYRAGQAGGYQVELVTNFNQAGHLPAADLERVLAEKRPIIVGLIAGQGGITTDVAEVDAPADSEPVDGQVGAGLLVPLVARGEVIGLIEIRDQHRRWLPEELSIIETIAQQLSQTAESLRLVDESQRHAAREASVNRIGEQIRGAHSLEEALRIAVKEVGLSLQAPQTLVRLAVGE